MSNKSSQDVTLAFLLGAFIGSILALLFAPVSGKKMRDLTKEKGEDLLDEADSLNENIVKPKIEELKEKTDEVIKKAESVSKKVVEDATDTISSKLTQSGEKLTEIGKNIKKH